MIDGIEFSGPGEAPTDFEQRLLTTIQEPTAMGALAARLLREVGPEAATRMLAIVLDEIGGGKVCLPQRRQYFQRLWYAERNTIIESLGSRPDWTQADIARQMGISRTRVQRILSRVKP